MPYSKEPPRLLLDRTVAQIREEETHLRRSFRKPSEEDSQVVEQPPQPNPWPAIREGFARFFAPLSKLPDDRSEPPGEGAASAFDAAVAQERQAEFFIETRLEHPAEIVLGEPAPRTITWAAPLGIGVAPADERKRISLLELARECGDVSVLLDALEHDPSASVRESARLMLP